MFTYHAVSRSPIPTPVYALLCIILSIVLFTFTLNAFAEAAPLTTHGSPVPGAITMSRAKMAASGYCFTLAQNPNVGAWSQSGGPLFEWRNSGCIPKWEDCVDAALAALKDREHVNPDYFSGIVEHGVDRGCGAIAIWS